MPGKEDALETVRDRDREQQSFVNSYGVVKEQLAVRCGDVLWLHWSSKVDFPLLSVTRRHS